MKEQSFVLPANPQRDLSRVVAFLSALPKDIPVKVTVCEAKKARSDAQNSALFGVAYPPLAEHTGYTVPELHDAFCRLFFGEVERVVLGMKCTMPRRTTTTDEQGKKAKISTKEFAEFYALVQRTAAEMENPIWIDDPDPRFHELKEMREAQ